VYGVACGKSVVAATTAGAVLLAFAASKKSAVVCGRNGPYGIEKELNQINWWGNNSVVVHTTKLCARATVVNVVAKPEKKKKKSGSYVYMSW